MGCTPEQAADCQENEKPVREITVNTFKISKTEITNDQYTAFLNDNNIPADGKYNGTLLINTVSPDLKVGYENGKWHSKSGFGKFPVVFVTWYGANEYCNWAGGRLPDEVEWEFAARGGDKSGGFKYAGSNDIDEVSWHYGNSNGKAHAVATRKPNEQGVYDMSGNVWEWCSNGYESYDSGNREKTEPVTRVLRGGSWEESASLCRNSNRLESLPEHSAEDCGFRLVLP